MNLVNSLIHDADVVSLRAKCAFVAVALKVVVTVIVVVNVVNDALKVVDALAVVVAVLTAALNASTDAPAL